MGGRERNKHLLILTKERVESEEKGLPFAAVRAHRGCVCVGFVSKGAGRGVRGGLDRLGGGELLWTGRVCVGGGGGVKGEEIPYFFVRF